MIKNQDIPQLLIRIEQTKQNIVGDLEIIYGIKQPEV